MRVRDIDGEGSKVFAEAIVETVPNPMLLLDAELRVLKATRSFYETFRVSKGDAEGRSFFDLGSGEWNIPRLRELLEEILPGDTRLDDFEVAQEFPSIGYRCMVLNARGMHRKSVGTLLLAMEDVTKRRQAEELIRKTELAIQEVTSQAILSVRADGKIVMANLMASKMFGCSREELFDQSLENLLPKRFREAHVAHRGQYFATPRNRNRAMGVGLDLRGLRKDGTEFPVAVDLSHIETKEGTLAMAFITDLSERKRAEEALRLSHERLTLAQQATGIGIWDSDVQANQAGCSREWGPLYGLPPGDLAPSRDEWLARIHPDDRERVREELRQAFEGIKVYNTEFRVVWPDGTIHWLLGKGNVFLDKEGKPVRMLGVDVDITNVKRAEEERRSLLTSLATAQQLQDLLTESNSALEQFASVASHDLQEPLRTMIVFAQSLAKTYAGKLDAEADQSLWFIVNAATRMKALIEDLLVYACIATEEERPSSIALDEALEVAIAQLSQSIAESGAAVTHDPMPTVRVDHGRMVQLFQNLVGNALKYRKPDQPPNVHIGAGKKGADWVISVRDNGIGFDPKFASFIFEPFKRLHTAQEYPGTGMGLAICQRIVEAQGGRIWAESKPGEGTTFFFTLPVEGQAPRKPSPINGLAHPDAEYRRTAQTR
jgi:PAS domain S-box-containing protein